MSDLPETICFTINVEIIKNLYFQEFVERLQRSQNVIINLEVTYGLVCITGEHTATMFSKEAIKQRVDEMSSNLITDEGGFTNPPQPTSNTIEMGAAKTNFLELFGEKHLDFIRKELGFQNAIIQNGKLQLLGDISAIRNLEDYLERTLHEQNVLISCDLKEHLELKCEGRLLKQFVQNYHVGTSLKSFDRISDKNGDYNYTKLDSSVDCSQPVQASYASSSNCSQQCIEVALCSDSKESLSKAVAELRSYRLSVESWTLKPDEITFILKQQQRGKPQPINHSVSDRCFQIKSYLAQSMQNDFVDVFVYYESGMWRVQIRGLKEHLHSAISKIKAYLNDVVETEEHIPISKAMAFFLRTKGLSDIKRLGKTYKVMISIIDPTRRRHINDVNDEQDNITERINLIGSMSNISRARSGVENFLESLVERKENYPCATWDLSTNISKRIKINLRKIQESADYDAIGFVHFYNSPVERRETTPKVTVTAVGLNEEMVDEINQQCKDICEGYIVWKPSSDVFHAIFSALIVRKSPSFDQFRQEWDIDLQLERDTNTIFIPARSKMAADEIKEALQSLSAGKATSMNRISEVIPIERRIRRFVNKAIRSTLDEAKAQKVYIDSKTREQLTLHGRSEVVTTIKEKINTIIEDIKRKAVTRRIKILFTESELIRNDSYKIAVRIERETNTIIRDVKADTKSSLVDINDDDDASLTITCVVNDRGQTILVKKGDIIKMKNVDAIVNAANGPLHHASGVDKAIADAAGPALEQECRELIAQNGGAPISTGKAVKTTAGNLPFKCVIHAIGPQYAGGNRQERPLLFFCILSSLRLAEQEGYTSVALPAISSMTYGFPLQDCTSIVVRAVKQFFADFPQSHVRQVILVDIDDSACQSFAREVAHNHTNAVDNNDIMEYKAPCPLRAIWYWNDQDGAKLYDENHTRCIENAFQQYLKDFLPSTLTIAADNLLSGAIVFYSIHFRPDLKELLLANPDALNKSIICGHQMREYTGYKRSIIRYPLIHQEQSTLAAYRPSPIDLYQLQVMTTLENWDISSITLSAVQQAEIAIREAIKSATISEPFFVNLNEDIDTHKEAITNIAIQESIKVDFQQDHTEKLSFILKGFRENVLQAKLKIALYAQDILRVAADKNDELDTPQEWGEQQEQCKLVNLPKDHPDFIRIENRMKESMNNVKIYTIERIQNLRLWNHYAFRRQTLQQELSNKPNLQIEMELFHGTRNTIPHEIYDGEYGFDSTFCSSGLWGLGTYFAGNASYSCENYSYKLPDGRRQVFLAQVLTGDVFDYKDQNEPLLRRPPKKDEKVSHARYNSVSGNTGSTKVYVIYENRLAYPTYLITFSP